MVEATATKKVKKVREPYQTLVQRQKALGAVGDI